MGGTESTLTPSYEDVEYARNLVKKMRLAYTRKNKEMLYSISLEIRDFLNEQSFEKGLTIDPLTEVSGNFLPTEGKGDQPPVRKKPKFEKGDEESDEDEFDWGKLDDEDSSEHEERILDKVAEENDNLRNEFESVLKSLEKPFEGKVPELNADVWNIILSFLDKGSELAAVFIVFDTASDKQAEFFKENRDAAIFYFDYVLHNGLVGLLDSALKGADVGMKVVALYWTTNNNQRASTLKIIQSLDPQNEDFYLDDKNFFLSLGIGDNNVLDYVLQWAVKKNHIDITEALLYDSQTRLENGILGGVYITEGDARTALRHAIEGAHAEILKLLLKDSYTRLENSNKGWTLGVVPNVAPIWPTFVVANGYSEILQFLLIDSRIRIQNDWPGGIDHLPDIATLINDAIEGSKTKIVEILLEDLRMRMSAGLLTSFVSLDNFIDDKGRPFALIYAIIKREYEIVKLLLEDSRIRYEKGWKKGVDPSKKESESLWTATQKGYFGIVELLLEDAYIRNDKEMKGGVNPSALNSKSLVRAAMNGYSYIVKLLLEDAILRDKKGMDGGVVAVNFMEVENDFIEDALETAAINNHHMVVKILLNDSILRRKQGTGDSEFDIINTTNRQLMLVESAKLAFTEIVKHFLDDAHIREEEGMEQGITPSKYHSEVLRKAVKHDNIEIIMLLLDDAQLRHKKGMNGGVDPTEAPTFSVVETFKRSWIDAPSPGVGPWSMEEKTVRKQNAFEIAVRKGLNVVVELLLDDAMVREKEGLNGVIIPSENSSWVLMVASFSGYTNVVEHLLGDANIRFKKEMEGGVIPTDHVTGGTATGMNSLERAILRGHGDVVELLLVDAIVRQSQNRDGVLKPNNDKNWGIVYASVMGDDEIVILLLDDARSRHEIGITGGASPFASNSTSLRVAVVQDKPMMVKRLLKDAVFRHKHGMKRGVDPTVNDYEIQNLAIESMERGGGWGSALSTSKFDILQMLNLDIAMRQRDRWPPFDVKDSDDPLKGWGYPKTPNKGDEESDDDDADTPSKIVTFSVSPLPKKGDEESDEEGYPTSPSYYPTSPSYSPASPRGL